MNSLEQGLQRRLGIDLVVNWIILISLMQVGMNLLHATLS